MKKAYTRQEGKRHKVLDEDRDKGVPIGSIFDDLKYLQSTDQHRAFVTVMYNVLLFP